LAVEQVVLLLQMVCLEVLEVVVQIQTLLEVLERQDKALLVEMAVGLHQTALAVAELGKSVKT
jgi:hypothetical protein